LGAWRTAPTIKIARQGGQKKHNKLLEQFEDGDAVLKEHEETFLARNHQVPLNVVGENATQLHNLHQLE
jgi:hypothetical protein